MILDRSPPRLRPLTWTAVLAAGALLHGGCGPHDGARDIVEAAIEAHGGDRFDAIRVRFAFRSDRFEVLRDGGLYEYRRTYRDDEGRLVVEAMENEGTWKEVDGERVPLDDEARASVELGVNSVVYFAFLPFRLMDPAVRHRSLGEEELDGEPYDLVEVTFREDGGGEDWEDRFVFWFHRDRHTLDYLAYRYGRGEGGSRFRKAVNRREVAGLVVQDYENYTADPRVEDIAEYGRLYAAGVPELVSTVELDAVRVDPVREGRPLP